MLTLPQSPVLDTLAACEGGTLPTAQQIIDKYTAAGLEAENPRTPKFQDGSPFPRSFSDGLTFDLPSLGTSGTDEPKHGRVLVCDTKENGDAIYAYLDTLKKLLGPYYYQSASGTVVAALDSTMDIATAAQYEAVIKSLP